jgi:hypothetical protein
MMTTEVKTPISRLERLSLEVSQDFAGRWLEVAQLPASEQAVAIAANVKAQTEEVATRFASWQKANTGYAETFEATFGPEMAASMVELAGLVDFSVFDDFASLACIVYRNADGSFASTFKLNKSIKLKGAKAPAASNGVKTPGTSRKARAVNVNGTVYPSMSAALKAVLQSDTPSSFDSGMKRLLAAKHTVVEVTS